MAEPGDGLSALESDDRITIDAKPMGGATFRVSDVEVEGIGITEVVAVSLVSGCDRYVLKGASHSDTCELDCAESDESWEVELTDIVLVE